VFSFVAAPDFGLFLLITILVFVPIAAFAFARSGPALRELGRGPWAIDRDRDGEGGGSSGEGNPEEGRERVEEIRQMVVAADYRRRTRGEDGIEVEQEVSRLLSIEFEAPESGSADDGAPAEFTGIVVEIRQLVIANNERRQRRGLEPLDVEVEVARRLEEWTP
jgi:hypothetical protein